jgi:hypothetical protein
MMSRALRVLVALAAAIVLSLAGLTTSAQPASAAGCTVSKSEYKKIKKGLTRAKVKKITKCSGTRIAYEGQSQTPKIKLYEYRTPGGNYIFIDFKSGKVLSKSRVSKKCWPWGC